MTGKRTCTYCVLDETVGSLNFGEDGRCDACLFAENSLKNNYFPNEKGQQKLSEMVVKLRREGEQQSYDCVIGLSGGIDSAYLAHVVVNELGLKPLAIHVDGGWNSEPAVRNIHSMVTKLNIDLHTRVIEWQEMKDLQIAFLRSGVINQDIPQDHAFFTSLYQTCRDFGIKSFLSGVNLASESITVNNSAGHPSIDGRHLKAIHAKFGEGKLCDFPTMSVVDYVYHTRIRQQPKIYKPLNWIDYDKSIAECFLKKNYGWADYGTKHAESRFTKFYQEIFLPEKIGYDKRRLHLSSQIVSGQLSREKALAELATDIINNREKTRIKKFVAKKLEISVEELNDLINKPLRSHRSYPNGIWLIDILKIFRELASWR